MEVDRKELSLIKEVLKSNPRGMTVTEISKEIRMNRHSVAKYLEVLAVSGHIDLKSFGPSKVYYISQRLPISAMLSFSSDFIIILDKDLRIVNINEKFLEFTDLKREDIIHKNLETFSFPLEFEPSIIPSVKEALDGKESIIEAVYQKQNADVYFFIKFIPTVFDDGEKGITIIFENITERKQSEKSIRESEQKFRSVIEQSLDGIILTDINGNIIEFNTISENITGLRREQVVGKPLWDAGFNVDETLSERYANIKHIYKNLKNIFSSYMKSGKTPIKDQLIELDITHADGSLTTVQVTYFSIIIDNGRMLCVMLRDVTSKKMIERAIIESEEKFRSIIEQTVNGVILIDKNGVIIEYNHAQESITGYPRKDIIGRYAWDYQARILPSENPASKINLKKDLLGLIKNGEAPFASKIQELEIRRKDGGRRIIRMIIFPIKMSIGYMICSISYDITEQKKIELEIKESEQKFRSIIEQSTDGFILTDEEGRIIEFNQGMEKISGYTGEDNLGKYLWDSAFFKETVSKADKTRYVHVKESITEFLKTGTSPISSRIIDREIKRKDGTISTLQIVVFPIKTEKGFKISGISRDITERKKMEDELKESEEKFRSLAETMANGIIILQGGHIVYTNPAVEKISGYTIEDAKRMSISAITAPEYMDLMDKAVDEAHKGKMPDMKGHKELKLLNSSGEYIWLEFTIGKLNYQGKPAIIITFFDVTHRKTMEEDLQKAHDDLEQRVWERTHELELANKSLHSEIEQRIMSEHALQYSENRYRYLVENINDIICETDRDVRYVYVSPRVRDVLGYEPDEMLNKTPFDFMREDEKKRIIDIFSNNIRNHEPLTTMEISMTHKDGRQILLEISLRMIVDQDGKTIGYNGIVRDLMQRKIVEEKLRGSEEKFRNIVEKIDDWVWEVDENLVFTYSSPRIKKLLGYLPKDMIGKKVMDFMSNEEGRHLLAKLIPIMNERQPFSLLDNKLLHKDGHEVMIETSGQPIFDNEGSLKGYRGINRDVTKKRVDENKLRWNEAFLRTMADNSPLAFYVVDDRDNRILYYNRLFIEIWGLSRIEDRIAARDMKDGEIIAYVLPMVEDGDRFMEIGRKYLNSLNIGILDDEIRMKDGRVIGCKSTQILDENDIYNGRLYIFEDITERKRAENALWENQRFLTTLIGNLPGMVYRCYNDESWTMDYVSEGCFDLTGYHIEDLVKNKKVAYDSIIHKEDREYVHVEVETALSHGHAFTVEYRIITASGETRWVWEHGCESSPMESGEKMIEGFITDITSRKLYEEKITSLASFPELNPNPVIELNAKEQIIYMNKAAKVTFPGLAPGHPMVAGLKPVYNEFKNGGLRSYSREVKLDATVYSQFIYYVPEQDLLRIYAADITKRKQAEEELRMVNRALRMINDCNQTLVRAVNEKQLLEDICRIIVEKGDYRLAWVGFISKDRPDMIVPAVKMGYDNGYVDSVNLMSNDDERVNGPTSTAIKSGQPVVTRYTAKDPLFVPWREEALKRGYASIISLPLRSKGASIGCLKIYSTKADAFDPAEIKLLMELADDLTYGLMSLRAALEHENARDMLYLMESTIESMSDAAFWIGEDARFYYVNTAASLSLGYTKEELLRMGIPDIDPTFDTDGWPGRWKQMKQIGHSRILAIHRKKDGTMLPVEINSNHVEFKGKQYDFAFSRALPDKTVEDVLRIIKTSGAFSN